MSLLFIYSAFIETKERKREKSRPSPRPLPRRREGGWGERLWRILGLPLWARPPFTAFLFNFFFMSRILQSCANSGRILNVQGSIKTNPRTVAIPGCLGGSSWVMPPDCIRRLEDGARFQSSSNVNRTLILINCTLRPYAQAITVILFHSLVVSW